MPRISFVVAIARNGAIGVDGDLPWRLPGDLAFFKRLTMGKPVIMGRKTWESLPRRPLPGRANIVVTRQADFQADFEADGACVVSSLADAIAAVEAEEVCIIGGAQLYASAFDQADTLYITEVESAPKADTFFPDFDRAQWVEVWRKPGPKEPEDRAPDYAFVRLDRRQIGQSDFPRRGVE